MRKFRVIPKRVSGWLYFINKNGDLCIEHIEEHKVIEGILEYHKKKAEDKT